MDTAYIPNRGMINNIKLPERTSKCTLQAFTQPVVFLPQLLTKVMCFFFQHTVEPRMFAKGARKWNLWKSLFTYRALY